MRRSSLRVNGLLVIFRRGSRMNADVGPVWSKNEVPAGREGGSEDTSRAPRVLIVSAALRTRSRNGVRL